MCTWYVSYQHINHLFDFRQESEERGERGRGERKAPSWKTHVGGQSEERCGGHIAGGAKATYKLRCIYTCTWYQVQEMTPTLHASSASSFERLLDRDARTNCQKMTENDARHRLLLLLLYHDEGKPWVNKRPVAATSASPPLTAGRTRTGSNARPTSPVHLCEKTQGCAIVGEATSTGLRRVRSTNLANHPGILQKKRPSISCVCPPYNRSPGAALCVRSWLPLRTPLLSYSSPWRLKQLQHQS